MTDTIELLREIYPKLDNGYKSRVEQAVNSFKEMQATIADLESTLARQPLPEAPASLTAKVIDRNTQIEWLVTVREAGRAKLLISAMPLINEWLAEQGLISFDVYAEERRAALPLPMKATQPKQGPAAISNLPEDALTFKAETLERSTNGEKTYYKIKGGKFAQYGVTIWPEALAEAGFDLDTLAGVTSLTGYTAYYVLNDKGKPAKVVGLAIG